jgi:adenylate kinase
VQRSDDQETTVRHRLAVYDKSTRPLVEYYRDRGLVEEVSGEGTVDAVGGAVVRAVERGR